MKLVDYDRMRTSQIFSSVLSLRLHNLCLQHTINIYEQWSSRTNSVYIHLYTCRLVLYCIVHPYSLFDVFLGYCERKSYVELRVERYDESQFLEGILFVVLEFKQKQQKQKYDRKQQELHDFLKEYPEGYSLRFGKNKKHKVMNYMNYLLF